MTKLTKTETKVLNSVNFRGLVFVNYGNATSRKSNNSFGLREKNAALSLVKKGLLRQLPSVCRGEMIFEVVA